MLQTIMQDYPEKVCNTVTSQNGKFHHRWGYSCRFCKDKTPSCATCEKANLAEVLGQDNEVPEHMGQRRERECLYCTDWWSKGNMLIGGDYYPITLAEELPENDPPVVRLNFKMLVNAVKSVWSYKQSYGSKATKTKAKKYLDLCCVSENFATYLIGGIFNSR